MIQKSIQQLFHLFELLLIVLQMNNCIVGFLTTYFLRKIRFLKIPQ